MSLAIMPKVEEIEKQTTDIVTQAQSLQVRDEATYIRAGEKLKIIKNLQTEVNATFDPVVQTAHEAHKTALNAKNKHLAPLEQAETIIKGKVKTYTMEQERIRAEELRKVREAEEARRKAEEELKAAEIARKIAELNQHIEIQKAEQEGDFTRADELMSEALPEVPDIELPEVPVLETPITPTVEGIGDRKVWKWRLVDIVAVPDRYKVLNNALVTAEVRAIKKQCQTSIVSQEIKNKIPGIEIYEDTDITVGR